VGGGFAQPTFFNAGWVTQSLHPPYKSRLADKPKLVAVEQCPAQVGDAVDCGTSVFHDLLGFVDLVAGRFAGERFPINDFDRRVRIGFVADEQRIDRLESADAGRLVVSLP